MSLWFHEWFFSVLRSKHCPPFCFSRIGLSFDVFCLDFSNFSAPRSTKLGRHSQFSGMGIPSQSNGLSKFFQEFLFRKRVKPTHPNYTCVQLQITQKYLFVLHAGKYTGFLSLGETKGRVCVKGLTCTRFLLGD